VTSYPTPTRISLLFNHHDPQLLSHSVRRTIASAVDSDALAEVVCGTNECAADSPSSFDAADTDQIPEHFPQEIELLAVDGSNDEAMAAKVVAHQLWEAHRIRVTVNLLGLEDMSQRLLARDYQLLLTPVPADARQLIRLFDKIIDFNHQSPGAPADAEVAVQELADQAILLPLWDLILYAGSDRRVCGVTPDSATSWLWLADLHFCEDEAD
jgi:hypothetical protein